MAGESLNTVSKIGATCRLICLQQLVEWVTSVARHDIYNGWNNTEQSLSQIWCLCHECWKFLTVTDFYQKHKHTSDGNRQIGRTIDLSREFSHLILLIILDLWCVLARLCSLNLNILQKLSLDMLDRGNLDPKFMECI